MISQLILSVNWLVGCFLCLVGSQSKPGDLCLANLFGNELPRTGECSGVGGGLAGGSRLLPPRHHLFHPCTPWSAGRDIQLHSDLQEGRGHPIHLLWEVLPVRSLSSQFRKSSMQMEGRRGLYLRSFSHTWWKPYRSFLAGWSSCGKRNAIFKVWPRALDIFPLLHQFPQRRVSSILTFLIYKHSESGTSWSWRSIYRSPCWAPVGRAWTLTHGSRSHRNPPSKMCLSV